jgi:hypothetical protein
MHRCDSCGLKSNLDLFFRSEKGGLFGFGKTICEGCTVYNRRPV